MRKALGRVANLTTADLQVGSRLCQCVFTALIVIKLQISMNLAQSESLVCAFCPSFLFLSPRFVNISHAPQLSNSWLNLAKNVLAARMSRTAFWGARNRAGVKLHGWEQKKGTMPRLAYSRVELNTVRKQVGMPESANCEIM